MKSFRMTRHVAVLAVAMAALLGGAGPAVAAPGVDFEPAQYKGPKAGPVNEVLVLGTPHLSGLPKEFTAAALGPLLDKLAAWQPKRIAIEALSGPQCHFMRQYPGRYAEGVESYCWDPAPARAATGLDVPQAVAAVDKLMQAWPAAPTPAQRRHLAALQLAAGERTSALVQWLRLPEAERKAGDGLDAALVEVLEKLKVRRNEDSLIAAVLAARLGLEGVVTMDDHTANFPQVDEDGYGKAIKAAWDNPASARRKAADTPLRAQVGTADGVLALYRAYNAPGYAKLVFEGDFGAAMEEPSPQHFGRYYLAYWQTRNLRMAAHIVNAMGSLPGQRTLVIVGAAHKGYLDGYLNQMHDVAIVDAQRVLQ